MNILVIAKIYHKKNSARALQMRRVINALYTYTDHSITLITEGDSSLNQKQSRLNIINVFSKTSKFNFFKVLFNKIVCELYCIHNSSFVRNSLSISEKIIKENKIDLLLTVSTPFDSHLVGLLVKNKFPNLNWSVFLSDLWPGSLLPKPYHRNKLFVKKEFSVMRSVVEKCDQILTPSKYSLELIRQKFNIKTKLKTVPHCSDGKTISNYKKQKQYLVHSGFLQKERVNKILVEAVNELAKENKYFKGLIHIGPFHNSLRKIIKKNNCKHIFLLGSVPEEISTSIQKLYKIGLIIEAPMGKMSPFMPSKITDVITNNQVLIAITPKVSFLSDFEKYNKGVYSCDYKKHQIKSCILEAMDSTEVISKETIDNFHPKNVAKLYDYYFKSLF